MKAKEYYEKYKDSLQNSETCEDACVNLFREMVDEAEAICEKRNVKLLSGQVAVYKEQNQKGNALANMLPELKRDFFKNIVLSQFPEMKKHWK